MKKIAYFSVCTLLILSVFAGCGEKDKNNISSGTSSIKDTVSDTVSDVVSDVSSFVSSMMPENDSSR